MCTEHFVYNSNVYNGSDQCEVICKSCTWVAQGAGVAPLQGEPSQFIYAAGKIDLSTLNTAPDANKSNIKKSLNIDKSWLNINN